MNAKTQTANVMQFSHVGESATETQPLAMVQHSTSALVLDGDSMDKMSRFALMMSKSAITVPKHLQGNEGDCFAIVMQAMQWGMNPFAVAQKTHLVNGILGYEAQLVNAVINSRAPISSRLAYEWFGDWSKIDGKNNKSDEIGVIVSATMRGESEPRTLSISMAQVGSVRNSPLWVSDPRQQIAYLATKRWSRLYCPDVILGVYTADEFEQEPMRDVTPQPVVSKTASVRDKVAAKKQGQVIDQPAQVEPVTPVEGGLEKVVSAIEVATTVEELAEYAKSFGNYGLSEVEIKHVNVAYKSKKAALLEVAELEQKIANEKALADFDADYNLAQ
jgi:hypothetical protein